MISEALSILYPWIKALHIMAVLAWMAGLFYLPRLFVYHVERGDTSAEMSETFSIMERKLFKVIMSPAMVVAWVCGILMAVTPGIIPWGDVWPYAKLLSIVAMSAFHDWCGRRIKEFAAGSNTKSGRHYRLMNEVPTLLMVVIVVSVIVRPV